MSADVCIICNECCVDEKIFDFWLKGVEEEDATDLIAKAEQISSGEERDYLLCEVRDQYCQCELIEKYMEYPSRLRDHCPVELTEDVARRLVQNYYDFDDAVIREFLGKKLTSRTRKDLEEVSLKTSVSVRSCRRQFDNFRRVFKAVEELKGYLTENIISQFLLSEKLSRKYAAAVFITNQRFETTKKRLQFLRFEDFAFCADLMIRDWSYSSVESHTADMDVDLDKSFLQQLKNFKHLQDKDTTETIKKYYEDLGAADRWAFKSDFFYSKVILSDLQDNVGKNVFSDVSLNFKNYFKNLLGVGVDLCHTRDLRDFFLDVVEKFIEPWKSANWNLKEAEFFMKSLGGTVTQSGAIEKFCKENNPSQFVAAWERYMRVMAGSALRMYAAFTNSNSA